MPAVCAGCMPPLTRRHLLTNRSGPMATVVRQWLLHSRARLVSRAVRSRVPNLALLSHHRSFPRSSVARLTTAENLFCPTFIHRSDMGLRLFVFWGLLLLAVCASASIFSSVTGLIHDPEHRPVQNARVTLSAQGSAWAA